MPVFTLSLMTVVVLLFIKQPQMAIKAIVIVFFACATIGIGKLFEELPGFQRFSMMWVLLWQLPYVIGREAARKR